MTTEIKLTENEAKALTELAKMCNGRSKADVEYLLSDPYTWCAAKDLVKCGWSKESAAGTFSALQDKGMIFCEDRDTAISEQGIRWVLAHWIE